MRVRGDMLNGFGVSHGGSSFLARRQRARVRVEHERARHGQRGQTRSRNPAPVELNDELIAVAEEESAGERLAFYRVTVARQDGICVGLMHATVYRTKEKHHPKPSHEH